MASSVVCSKYGPFNGVYALEQSNWASFFRGFIPDCVISSLDGGLTEMGGEFEAYAVEGGEGMQIRVKAGQAFVNGHHIWSSSETILTVAAADATYDRIDSVVLRIAYGNNGLSKAYVAIITGDPGADPVPAEITQNTGTIYEYRIATVTVPHGETNTILPSYVSLEPRTVYRAGDGTMAFNDTSVTPSNGLEYRCTTAQSSMQINLPNDPHPTFITSVRFPSGSTFSGVTIYKGSTKVYDASTSTNSIKLKGDALTIASRVYTLEIWWDGTYYWVASAAVA